MSPQLAVRVAFEMQLLRLKRQLASAAPIQRTPVVTPRASWHGTRRGYAFHECRCTPCVWAEQLSRRRRRAERVRVSRVPMPVHGTVARYSRGCRCASCGVTHSSYQRAWRDTQKQQGANHGA